MASKSKIKGSAYEAKIRDLLTKELNIEFKRMPLSGSIEYLKGDLWTPHDTAAWPYCIECKHYKEVNWNGLLTATSSDLLNFWRQAQREAEVMKKKPVTVDKDMLAAQALSIMNNKKITSLCIHQNNKKNKIIGFIHIHTILNANIT